VVEIYISIPNFAKISQSMAQIYTVTISGFGKRTAAILDSTSGYDFDLIFVISLSFCIGLLKFVKIELPSAKL